MLNILSVGIGGFLGTVLRYLIGLVPVSETLRFPIKTFIINVVGCILIAIITVLVLKNSNMNPKIVLFIKTGLCGGFTTFSTFALESSDFIGSGHLGIALLYILLSVGVGIATIFVVEYINLKL